MLRQLRKKAFMMMGTGMLLCMAPSTGFWSVSASAQVNINVNIGQPPPVIVRERPTMVYLAEPAAYVAVGVPFDIFFVSGRYYYMHGGNWFWGSAYNGPWVAVPARSIPNGLRKYKIESLHEFREREYHVYQVQGPAFKGKHFEAEEHREDHDDDHGNGGHGNGRGKGNK